MGKFRLFACVVVYYEILLMLIVASIVYHEMRLIFIQGVGYPSLRTCQHSFPRYYLRLIEEIFKILSLLLMQTYREVLKNRESKDTQFNESLVPLTANTGNFCCINRIQNVSLQNFLGQ